MANIAPFGNNVASGTPEIGLQLFCGGVVSSFNCSADFNSQAGSLTVNVVEDEENGYRFRVPVVSAPTGFLIQDIYGNPIFRFNGIFDSISRNVGPNEGKTYAVTLSSPLRILQAATIVTDTYAGYGRATEGLPPYYSQDGYYNTPYTPADYLPVGVSKVPSGTAFQVGNLAFGTNNANLEYRGMWANQYNIINVFGAFENDSVGIVPFRGFGASASSDEGMTLDRVCYALDELINRTGSGEAQRYLGGNLLFGTNTYNVCSTAQGYSNPNPYFYGFDAIGFYNQVVPFLGANYRVKGPLNILDMITEVCNEINADFMVNLDLVDYTTGNFTTYSNTGYSVYTSGTFELAQTYPHSLLGGVISVQVLPRNTYVNCQRPFSDIAYNLFQLEIPNFGGYGTESGIHPGIFPTGYIDPLDDDYIDVGTKGSTPYGGAFPGGSDGGNGSLIQDTMSRITNGQIAIKASDGTTAKMVVGGYQTRMINVERDFIYQYWGDIKVQTSGIPSCTGLNRNSDKIIPVITQILPHNDIVDLVMIDISDIIPRNVNFWESTYWDHWRNIPEFANTNPVSIVSAVQDKLSGKSGVAIQPICSGIYFASVAEIRAAMTSRDEWEEYMMSIKREKFTCLNAFFKGYSAVVNNVTQQNFANAKARTPSTITTREHRIRQQDGNSVYTGFRERLEVKLNFGKPDELEPDLFLDMLSDKIKTIGDQHYGRSWYVPVPFFTSKVTENNDNLFGNFVRSWDLTNSAYVEPSLYYTINAPFDSRFVDDGKLLPFINYDYYIPTGNLGYDLFTNKIYGFSISGKPIFDFSEYATDKIVVDNTECFPRPLVHVPPSEIGEKYQFLPCNYFAKYNRYMAPFFEILLAGSVADTDGVVRSTGIFGSTYAYATPLTTGIMPSSGLNNCGATSALANALFNDNSKLSTLSTSQVMATGHNGFFIQYPTTANYNVAANVLALQFNDNGLNSLPFVKVTTERVFYPNYEESGVSINDKNFRITLALLSMGTSQGEINQYLQKFPEVQRKSQLTSDYELFPPVVPPKSIAVPQRSNRFVYGPWMSTYNILYCGRVDFEVNTDIVPENYIIPSYGSLTLAGGVFSSGINSQTSGFAGMNLAGQAIANSIDNFSLFANEEGTITIPGLPLISYIGQNLFSFPRVTDIQVNISNNNISTTYNFRQHSPRIFRTNRDVVQLLTKISKSIKK